MLPLPLPAGCDVIFNWQNDVMDTTVVVTYRNQKMIE